MSNYLAIATATATLRRFLQGVVADDVSGATVTTVRPDAAGSGLPETGVNLFLYQVTPNPELRNRDLPTRRSDGSAAARPEAALDLHYLLTFYGNHATLEPQRLLGSVARSIHARPVLSREMILATLADPAFAYLAGSDLADAPDKVRLTPQLLKLEELYQLWSGLLSKADFATSLVYRAGVVLLTAEEPATAALPVRERTLTVQPIRSPRLASVVSAAGDGEPIVVGSTLVLRGERLAGERTEVRLAGQEVEPAAANVSAREIRLPLAPPLFDVGTLRAGPQGAQVLHPFLLGDPPQPRPGFASNVAAFVLRPLLSDLSYQHASGTKQALSGTVTCNVSPPIAVDQRLVLELNGLPGLSVAGLSYVFAVPPVEAPTTALEAPVAGVAPGVYLVRLSVDGAASPLVADTTPGSATFGLYMEPAVEIGAE